jgi:hypothetical protein
MIAPSDFLLRTAPGLTAVPLALAHRGPLISGIKIACLHKVGQKQSTRMAVADEIDWTPPGAIILV